MEDQRKSLLFARSCAFSSEHPDIGSWLGTSCADLYNSGKFRDVQFYTSDRFRIHESRNDCVLHAKKLGVDILVFVDPDMKPDMYWRVPGVPEEFQQESEATSRQFLFSSLKVLEDHPLCVVGAPACSGGPEYKCNVFVLTDDKKNIRRVTREEAAVRKEGIEHVSCIGTGLMMIPMKVFDVVEPPWFIDEYRDPFQSKIHATQDSVFCLKCAEKKIPVFANWYSWAGHWKLECVGRPKLNDGKVPEKCQMSKENTKPERQPVRLAWPNRQLSGTANGQAAQSPSPLAQVSQR